MQLLTLLLLLFFNQDQTPYKPKEEFELKLNFEFKSRTIDKTVAYNTSAMSSTGPLPYLKMELRVVKLSAEEVRVRITRNGGEAIFAKKTDPGMTIKLDLGFTDDIKDRVTANEYTVYFLSPEKKQLSKIEILFEKDGTYLVNGEKRGKV